MDEPTASSTVSTPESQPPPVIGPGYTLRSVTDKISSIVLTRPTSRRWYFGFMLSFSLVMLLLYALAKLVLSASASGALTSPSPGALPSPTSCGGLGSAMPAP